MKTDSLFSATVYVIFIQPIADHELINMIIKALANTKLLIGFLFFGLLGTTNSLAQSRAHERAGFAVIDPVYNFEIKIPQPNIKDNAPSWIYGPAKLECWRLQLLQQRKDSANLKVGYPGVFHIPYTNVSYRFKFQNQVTIDSIKFRAVGQGKISINNLQIGEFKASDSVHLIFTADENRIHKIRFDINSSSEPPALLIESETLSTSKNAWEWKPENGNWETVSHFPQTVSGVPPHKQDNPTVFLNSVSSKDRLFDFGSELFGLKPLNDGWKHFSLKPEVGCLDWANVSVPTKYGDILVDIDK